MIYLSLFSMRWTDECAIWWLEINWRNSSIDIFLNVSICLCTLCSCTLTLVLSIAILQQLVYILWEHICVAPSHSFYRFITRCLFYIYNSWKAHGILIVLHNKIFSTVGCFLIQAGCHPDGLTKLNHTPFKLINN